MKKIVFTLLFFASTMQMFGQSEETLPNEGKLKMETIVSQWIYRTGYVYKMGADKYDLEAIEAEDMNRTDWDYIWFLCSGQYFYTTGETREKNGHTYSVLKIGDMEFASGGEMGYYYRDDYVRYDYTSLHEAEICIREEGGRVYVDLEEYKALMEEDFWRTKGSAEYLPYEQTEDGELVLYDFNMQVGDKFPSVAGHEDIYVSSIETVTTLDGRSRKQWVLSNGLHIIDQVGCVDSNGEFLFYLNPSGLKQCVSIMISCTKDDTRIIFPDDSTGIREQFIDWPFDFSLTTSVPTPLRMNEGTSSTVYDLQGRRLTSKPTKGIYIQNGRKVVVK